MMRLSSADLRWRLNATADYLTDYWGLPSVTAKTIVLNIAATLVSSFTRVEWRDTKIPLGMPVVVAPGVVDENRGYADFLAEPMEHEITRRREAAAEEASFSTKKRAMEEMLMATPKDNTDYDKHYDEYLILLETASPWFMLRMLPRTNQYDPLLSTVLIDDTGDVLRHALEDGTGAVLSDLEKGYQPPTGKRRFYGVNLEAPHDGFGKLLGTSCARSWQPIILPGGVGVNLTRYRSTDREKVAKVWTEAINELLILRRIRGRILRTNECGIEAVNRVIQMAGSYTKCAHHRGKFTWVARATVKLAAVYHLLTGEAGDEISSPAWDEAAAHMQSLIDAHAVATDVAIPVVKKNKAFFGRPEDLRTLTNYLSDNPKASARDVIRALSKRKPGYWKAMYAASGRR